MYSKGVITIFVAESVICITIKTERSKSRFIPIGMSRERILVGCIQPEVFKLTAITIDGQCHRLMWSCFFGIVRIIGSRYGILLLPGFL